MPAPATKKKRGINRDIGITRRSMEVLLAEDISTLGNRGEIVKVKPGYARNYLLPHGYATIATEENKRAVEQHKKKLGELEVARVKTLRQRADAVSKYSVTLEAHANAEGHLYGSVLAHDISKALKTAGYDIETDHIKLEGPLKELGMYTVKLELHPEVRTDVKVWVVPTAST
ncbi:MAG: 50S ribosomal protein L9 [Planctomycetaceae bacterium]|nr:50S ribosomal protein L9 [Planctomycetaceae bacterium]